MNLHGIASAYIGAVNPNIIGSLSVSNGYTTGPDGTRTPTYAVYQSIPFQVQAATGPQLAHLESINVQGVVRIVYLNGNIEGLDRPAGKGGDLLLFNNQLWLVAAVLEPWDTGGFVKVAVTLQNNS